MVKGYSDCNPSLKEKSLCVGTKTDKSITQSGLKVGENVATHLEYITNQKFNSSFKNMLRDYYTYGFKDRSEYSVSRGTYDSDRKRLNDFLNDYMEWSEIKKRKNQKRNRRRKTYNFCFL